MNHNCCKSKTKLIRGRADPFIIGIVVFTVIALGLIVILGLRTNNTPQVHASSRIEMTIPENSYSWGNIDYSGGIVSKEFEIENTSSETLQLYDVKTSCMCTTAQLVTPEETSPEFGMHNTSTKIVEVKPGESARLVVDFDPAYHGPSGVGPITRTVNMSTNDENNPTLTFNLTGTVIMR